MRTVVQRRNALIDVDGSTIAARTGSIRSLVANGHARRCGIPISGNVNSPQSSTTYIGREERFHECEIESRVAFVHVDTVRFHVTSIRHTGQVQESAVVRQSYTRCTKWGIECRKRKTT